MNTDNIKHFGDIASLLTVIATIAHWMPEAAAFVSFIWGLIRIYESKTVQRWLKK
ncbi:MAG: hypothetical protein KGL35_19700 [Bradyrhizobium sp.]|nr:hypothetical protein [Bradyrhizobium sp.]